MPHKSWKPLGFVLFSDQLKGHHLPRWVAVRPVEVDEYTVRLIVPHTRLKPEERDLNRELGLSLGLLVIDRAALSEEQEQLINQRIKENAR